MGLILMSPMAIKRDSLLELTPVIRAGVQYANGTSKSERHFLDFVVDGQSLWRALGERHDMVSILCAEYSAAETAKAIERLRLNEKAELPNGRCSFFVCSECGDLGCGAITALVERQGETMSGKHSATRTPTRTTFRSIPTELLAHSLSMRRLTSVRSYKLWTFFNVPSPGKSDNRTSGFWPDFTCPVSALIRS